MHVASLGMGSSNARLMENQPSELGLCPLEGSHEDFLNR